jgi:acyl-phosphate glycerol 3-phosphate acyltransferase
MTIAGWAVAAFLCGSLMFSRMLARLAKKDLRAVGDGNPGAFNLWKAAGPRWGLAGIALDVLKGYVPVLLFLGSGSAQGYAIALVGSAPIAGHAFSPFLRGKGGKAIAVTFGVWCALTRFEGAIAYAVILAALSLVFRAIRGGQPSSTEEDGVQVVLGMLLLGPYLLLRHFPDPVLAFWLVNFILLTSTNRRKLVAFATGPKRSKAQACDRHVELPPE